MHVQAPTLISSHRTSSIVAAAFASAAIAGGVFAIANNNDSSKPAVTPAKPALVQNVQDRVLDGSPLVRGTQSTPILDGSPLLRGAGSSPGAAVTQQNGVERVWDGSPILRGTALKHSGVPRVKPSGLAPTESGLGARRP
jgi:hypothetical protein